MIISINLFQVKNSVLKQVRLLLLLCFIMCPGSAFSQDKSDMKHDSLPIEILNAPEDLFKITLDTLSIKERIYVRTNFLEWALLSPNAMVEFDILPYNWNKWTIAVGGRYNDFAKQVMSPKNVFNVKTFRVETRRYWHTTDRSGSGIPRGREYDNNWSIWRKAISRQRANPREEKRAYYAGAFISMSDFSIKLGQQGKQGKATMFGGTFGFQQPLYGYTSGSTVDLEFGVSAGVAKVEYDTYQYNSKFDCYPKIGKTKNEIVPSISEVRLALVYRFGRSSRERYFSRYTYDRDYQNYKDSINFEKLKERNRRISIRDSIAAVRKEEHRLDSLKKVSPVLYAHEMYKKLQEEKGEANVDIDSTEFGRMLREVYAEHRLLKEAKKVSPERYQQVKDSLDALKDANKAAQMAKSKKKKDSKKAASVATSPNVPVLPEGDTPKSKKKKAKKDKKADEVEATEVKQDSVPVPNPIAADETPTDSVAVPAVTPTESEETPAETPTESEETPVDTPSEPEETPADTPTESEATTPEEKGGESE